MAGQWGYLPEIGGNTTDGTAGKLIEGTAGRPIEGTAGRPIEGTAGRPTEGTAGRPIEGNAGKIEGSAGNPTEGTTTCQHYYKPLTRQGILPAIGGSETSGKETGSEGSSGSPIERRETPVGMLTEGTETAGRPRVGREGGMATESIPETTAPTPADGTAIGRDGSDGMATGGRLGSPMGGVGIGSPPTGLETAMPPPAEAVTPGTP